MSSTLETRLELIRTSLAAAAPTRTVTRDAKDPGQYPTEIIRAGVYTITSLGESDFTNNPGYIAQDGKQRILITGDIALADGQSGAKVEAAEFAMCDEIKNWLRNLPEGLCMLQLLRIATSGQSSGESGWIVAELEYIP